MSNPTPPEPPSPESSTDASTPASSAPRQNGLVVLGRWFWNYGLTLTLLLLITYKLVFVWVPLWVKSSEMEGMDVSSFGVISEQGDIVLLEEFKGQPLILNFWATWCLPCRVEVPQLASVYPELQAQGKQLLGINLRENWDKINAFRADVEMPYPQYLDTGGLAQVLGIEVIPALVVIDAEGRIDRMVFGYRPWVEWYLKWWL